MVGSGDEVATAIAVKHVDSSGPPVWAAAETSFELANLLFAAVGKGDISGFMAVVGIVLDGCRGRGRRCIVRRQR